jgi:maltose alpha-D-glucosyltransferase/alpha-amylase
MRQGAGDIEFVRLMLEHLHAADTVTDESATIRCQPTEGFAGDPLPMIEAVRSVGVEQTNSSIIVNDQFVLKVYRQLQSGLNPDLEIGRHLAKRGYRNTPEFLGGAEIDIDGKASALAVLHRFVQNQGDAWALSAGYLDRALEECRLLGADCSLPQESHATYLERMTEIGVRLAELHGALADEDDEAFTLEPMLDADVEAEKHELLDKAEKLFADLQRSSSLPDRARQIAEAVLARKDEIVRCLTDAVPIEPLPFKMRYHGDFHLGQVMIVQGDVFILDFEGEPRRRMEDRRRKGVALRDVAGLLRSLDYAGLSAIQRLTLTLPDASNSVNRAVDEWRHLAEAAFLNAYHAGMADHPAWPGEEAAARWLNFLQLDKVVYEVGYELANRPSWLHVPLIGLWALLFRDESLPS